MSVELVYETHAVSTHNEAGVATGWLPGELSPRGRELAAELGRRRRDDGVSAVFSSDSRRAVETAEIAFAGTPIPVLLDWRLRECDYGELTGGPAEQIRAVAKDHIDEAYPGGESYRDVVARMSRFLDDLFLRWEAKRLVVIGHAATRWSLQHLLDGEPLEDVVAAPFEWQAGWEYRVRPGIERAKPRLSDAPSPRVTARSTGNAANMRTIEVRRGRRRVRLTHLDRVFWPESAVTKRDLVDYYTVAANVIVPHLRNRPFTIKRHFTVPRGPYAWQKDAPPELPDWIPVSPQPAKSRHGALVRYPLVNDAPALRWMVEYGCIDLHVWPSRIDRQRRFSRATSAWRRRRRI